MHAWITCHQNDTLFSPLRPPCPAKVSRLKQNHAKWLGWRECCEWANNTFISTSRLVPLVAPEVWWYSPGLRRFALAGAWLPPAPASPHTFHCPCLSRLRFGRGVSVPAETFYCDRVKRPFLDMHHKGEFWPTRMQTDSDIWYQLVRNGEHKQNCHIHFSWGWILFMRIHSNTVKVNGRPQSIVMPGVTKHTAALSNTHPTCTAFVFLTSNTLYQWIPQSD